jgi:hypothetical protein
LEVFNRAASRILEFGVSNAALVVQALAVAVAAPRSVGEEMLAFNQQSLPFEISSLCRVAMENCWLH